MDSENSLIEISGEDDSLLLQPIPIPNDPAAATLDRTYFPCSPLQSAPSVTSVGVDKENVGVESLQRKRKNKKCGYNLRKSLAWNRAFLTEEGVLDPVELSMISGSVGDVMSDKLAVIHEGDQELSHENTVSHSGSESLPALEEKQFQKLPRVMDNGGQSTSRSLIKTSSTTAKPTRIPVPSAKRRVLAAQDVNGSRSKHNSISSVRASSSLKRAASSNTTNSACKDLKKVSKARTATPDSGLPSSTANTASSFGYPRQSQCAKPGIPSGRKVRMERPLANAACPQSNLTRSTASGKLSTVKSTTRKASENAAQPQPRMNTLNVKSTLKPPIQPSNKNEVGSASTGVSLVEKAEPSEVKLVQVQRTEPTGLRMPSPSFSFFAQPRASASPRSITNSLSFNDVPPISSNTRTPHGIGSAGATMLASVRKLMLTPDIKSKSNAKWINSNVKTSDGYSTISRERGDANEACDNIKSFCQHDVEELSILSKFSSSYKEASEDFRGKVNKIDRDVPNEDENATEGYITGTIAPVTSTQTMEECIGVARNDNGAFPQTHPEDYNSTSWLRPSTSLLLYCGDDDKEAHQQPNNSSLRDHNETAVKTQCPERYDENKSGLISPSGRTPQRCKCENDDPDGPLETGWRLDSEEGVNRGASSPLKVQVVTASLASNHCLIIASDVNQCSTQQPKYSSSNSEQTFSSTSFSDNILKGSTGHIIASELAPASTDGDVTGGPNSFSVPSHRTSDKPGSLDSSRLGEDRAISPSIASGDGACDGQRKNQIDPLKSCDFSDSVKSTTHEEPMDTTPDVLLSGVPAVTSLTEAITVCIGTPQSKAEPPFSKEGAEDNRQALPCCPIATLQPINGSVDSDQIASLAQVDFSHGVGAHLDSIDVINPGSYLEIQSEQAFDELDMSVPAENANGDVAADIVVCEKTESEMKIEMLDSGTRDDNVSCEMNRLNTPKCVDEALDCSHQLGNQETSSSNGTLADKAASEESLIETKINREINSPSLISRMKLNNEQILVALGVPSFRDPEIGPLSDGNGKRTESMVAEDARDDLAKFIGVASPLQPLVLCASSSPVREESHDVILASPSPEDVEADISFASIVQLETKNVIKTGDINESTEPTDDLESNQKQDHAAVKPPPDAVPYSDEWLAAIEAAGEDILKLKSGAVQNSPPERSEEEPNPWSPVRRKNNQAIGPFDCTKFINVNVPSDSP